MELFEFNEMANSETFATDAMLRDALTELCDNNLWRAWCDFRWADVLGFDLLTPGDNTTTVEVQPENLRYRIGNITIVPTVRAEIVRRAEAWDCDFDVVKIAIIDDEGTDFTDTIGFTLVRSQIILLYANYLRYREEWLTPHTRDVVSQLYDLADAVATIEMRYTKLNVRAV